MPDRTFSEMVDEYYEPEHFKPYDNSSDRRSEVDATEQEHTASNPPHEWAPLEEI